MITSITLHVVCLFQLNKKVDDIEITWSLGALFNYYGKFNTHV